MKSVATICILLIAGTLSTAIAKTPDIISINMCTVPGNFSAPGVISFDFVYIIIYNHFGPGRAGIKLNVFSTGSKLNDHDSKSIFLDGFRGNNSLNIHSRGHGLAFVKYVVELHGGQVGYEPTQGGNNFFFVLPLLS